LEEREYEIIKLQTQNKSLQESVLQLQSENQNLQQKYDSLEEAMQQDIESLKLSSQDETQSLQMILSQKESTQQALSKKLHDSEQKQMQKDEEVLALRTNLEKQRQSYSEALNALDDLKREYSTFQHNYQIQMQAQSDSSIWEQKFKEESDKCLSLHHQIGQKDNQSHELEERNKELEAQIFDVELDMDQLQTQHGEELTALQEKISSNEKEASKFLKGKDKEILQLKFALEQLKKENEIKLASTSSEKEKKLDSLMNDLITKDDEILQNLTTIASLKNQVHDFRHDRETSDIQLEKAKQEIAEMKAKLESLEAEKNHTRNKIDHLEHELHVCQNSIISQEQSKQAELSGLYDRVNDLKEMIGTKENDYRELHRKWSEMQTEAETLRQHQTTSELMLKELQEQSVSTDEELADRKATTQQLQEEFTSCHAQLLLAQEKLELVTNSIPHLPSSEEEAESMEGMRKQIISLAHALEKAEVAKLEALERVAKERKQNAESLRKWSESLKQFYHATVM